MHHVLSYKVLACFSLWHRILALCPDHFGLSADVVSGIIFPSSLLGYRNATDFFFLEYRFGILALSYVYEYGLLLIKS